VRPLNPLLGECPDFAIARIPHRDKVKRVFSFHFTALPGNTPGASAEI
jgi:hypothetical protein